MDIVTGALDSVLSKLAEFLKDEYNLQAGVREKIRSLSRELEDMHAALRKVAELPPNEVDELVKLWARDVRELSYTVEDILDDFLVRVQAGLKRKDPDLKWYHHVANKILEVFSLSQAMARREISSMIDIINEKAKEVAMRRERYRVDSIVAKPAASSRTVDPRLNAMYTEASQIIGIDKSSADLISMLSPKGDDESNQKMKIVSVVGVGGLGKTTLAKAVYDKRDKSHFGYGAFVPVGQDPDLKKIFRNILICLDNEEYKDMKYTVFDEKQLIDELRVFLKTKRYFVVIDDIWEPQSWETIKSALVENNCGSRIIITTRIFEVAKKADEVYKLEPLSHDNSKKLFHTRLFEVYKLEPLSHDNSKKLFHTRLFGGEDKCPTNHVVELSDMILKKCGGVPLAIITMASLLLGKSRKEWIEVCNSPGFYDQDKDDWRMENTIHILSLSYYDLPSHLKTCLLYLSVFPEDTFIDRDSLIWMWIAEGFVEKKPGRDPFEVGEEYFLDLINRSMIQGVDSEVYGIIDGCHVHDMVLGLIVSMSHEENFVSVDGTLSQSDTRRLVLKNRELDLAGDSTDLNLPQVRSFIVWGWCDIDNWALHPRLKLLRVLALDCCTFEEGCHNLEHIGNLHHLRYLGIRGSWIEELLGGIGDLKFLQTLELYSTNGDLRLPCSIGMLTQLVCLRAQDLMAPDGVIGRLTSLEELQIGGPHNDESQFVKDLGNLRELRVLNIRNIDESTQIDLVQSLGNLKKMQHLTLGYSIDLTNMNGWAWDAAVPSRNLRSLFLHYGMRFPKLPSWINSAHLPSLSHLELHADDVDDQSLKALGGLPDLCYLKLETHTTATITEADVCFQKLRSLMLPHSTVVFVANEDSTPSFTICSKYEPVPAIGRKRVVPAVVVMPNLEELLFSVSVEELMENNVVSFEGLGLDYLPSIRRVEVHFWCDGAFKEDVEREEAALRDEIQVHSNRPALQTHHLGIYEERQLDDDASATEWRGRQRDRGAS